MLNPSNSPSIDNAGLGISQLNSQDSRLNEIVILAYSKI